MIALMMGIALMSGLGGGGAESDCREKNQAGDDSPDVQFRVHVLSPDIGCKMDSGGLGLF